MNYRIFCMRMFILLLFTVIGISCCSVTRAQSKSGKAKHVVMITIDGLRLEMITDKEMPSPALKELAAAGTLAERVVSVAPAMTYPNHTALVTGARPIHHGIFYNAPFEGNRKTGIANWYADSIKCPTIWGKAKEHGLITCSLFWPVSTHGKDIDYNVPEYWPIDKNVSLWELLRKSSTPAGILDEIERETIGRFSDKTYCAGHRNGDVRTAFMAVYLLDKYRPNLTTIHLWSTDHSQHQTGTESVDTKKSLAAVDYAIGEIVDGLERAGMLDSTVLVITGDHGFTDVNRSIAPNVWLVEAGLLTGEPDKWKARFYGAGSTAFLYLRDKNDRKTLDKVRAKLNSLPEEKHRLFRIVEKAELKEFGCSPDVEFALEPIVGVGVTSVATGEDIIIKKAGKHGYLLPRETTSAIIWGRGIASGKIVREMNITDIAPVIMKVLGIDFTAPDGVLRPGILE